MYCSPQAIWQISAPYLEHSGDISCSLLVDPSRTYDGIYYAIYTILIQWIIQSAHGIIPPKSFFPPIKPYTNASITHEYLSAEEIFLSLYLEDGSLNLRILALRRRTLTHTYRLYPEAFWEFTCWDIFILSIPLV